jgi:uncharacterized protein
MRLFNAFFIIEILLAIQYSQGMFDPNKQFLDAMASWNIEKMEQALSNGASVNTQISKGLTPLHNAACSGKLEVIAFLLSKGADPNIKDELGSTPLHLAAAKNRKDVTQLMLAHNANVNISNGRGIFPLLYAICFQDSALVQLLLQAGGHVTLLIRGYQNKTLLEHAEEKGGIEIINLLKASIR